MKQLLLGLALCTSSVFAAPLEVTAPDEVEALLLRHLDLARALARADKQPLDADERLRLCGVTAAQVRELLETLGYFNPVEISLDCDAARLRVEPGMAARLRHIDFQFGAPDAQADDSERAAPSEEVSEVDWRSLLPLAEGDTFTTDRWATAKRAVLAQARARGYPLASWRSTSAEIDAPANAVDVQLIFDPGIAVRLGRIEIEGLKYFDRERTLDLLGLTEGRRYSEQRLLNAQERLLKSGLFDSVQVELDIDHLVGDRMPVRVKVKESSLQQLSLGVGWQSNTGERVSLEHIHRQAFGLPLRSRIKLALGSLAQEADFELSTHPQARQLRELVSFNFQREASDDAPFRQFSIKVGQVFETRREDRTVSLDAINSRQGTGLQLRNANALVLNYNPTWRDLDNVLLPTRGNAWLLQSAVGFSRSNDALGVSRKGGLLRLHGRWQHYMPLAKGRQVGLRLEAGHLWSQDEQGVPESLRWRAGGDESVRGYSYRSLGPEINGQGVGGSAIWTASAEFTQPLPPRWVGGLDGLGVAVFADAGQAGQSWRDVKNPAAGAGLGLRWRSPVGLLRADVAHGQPTQGGGWRLHISVGLAL